MLAEGRQADPAGVTPRMVRAGYPRHLAGSLNAQLAELLAEPLVPAGWRRYAREVLLGAAVRRVEAAGQRLAQAAEDCPEVGPLRALVTGELSDVLAELVRVEAVGS